MMLTTTSQRPGPPLPKSGSVLVAAVLLLAAAGCQREPEPPTPPELPRAENPVERRVAPVRAMAAEADSTVRAAQQRMQEEADAAR